MLPRRITLVRAALPVKCPSCGAEISWQDAGVEFLCPACGHGVHLRHRYFRVLYVLSALLATLVAYAIGIRGDVLFGSVFILLVPTYILLVFVTLRLFPPDVEATGDYRGILYGANRLQDVRPVSEAPENRRQEKQVSTQPASVSGPHGSMFRTDPEHRTLEGVVLRGAGIVLYLSMAWIAGRPLMYRFLPELGATQKGPPAFPVTVHIGLATIGFTNGSTQRWTCKADLGFTHPYAFTFAVEAQQTREVPYVSFQHADGVDSDECCRSAREKIAIACAEPSGLTHFWEFR